MDEHANNGELAGGCILLVEDDPTSAKVATLALHAASCNVQWVSNAQDAALLLFAGLKPTAILLDLELPGATGLDLARFLKASPALASVPIVAVTASGPGFGSDAAHDAHCDAYLPKPIDVTTIAAEIARCARGLR